MLVLDNKAAIKLAAGSSQYGNTGTITGATFSTDVPMRVR